MQQVPQFIDIQDKVAGNFTWQQLGWFVGAGAILVFLWQVFEKPAFYTSAVPIILITAVFAFYRPQGMPFVSYVRYALIYFFQPRLFLWQREVHVSKNDSKQHNQIRESQQLPTTKRTVSAEDIASLSQALDSHGEKTNARLQEILKETSQRKRSNSSILSKIKKRTVSSKKKKSNTPKKQ